MRTLPATGLLAAVVAFAVFSVFLVSGAFKGGGISMAMQGLSLQTRGEVPPIDREAPASVQTATFALG